MLLAVLALGCAEERRTVVEELPSPAGAGAAEPFLSAVRDGVLLSWLEPVAGTDRTALRFAMHRNGAWSAPRTVVERNDLFVNWADFPSVVEDAKGALFAHWLQKSGAGKYAYDVRMAVSADGGATWGTPFLLSRDGTEGDRRAGGGHGHAGRAALAGARVQLRLRGQVAARVDCRVADGHVAAVAGHLPPVEPRRADAAVRQRGQRRIHARPRATAWFTAANGQPRVYAAFDGGEAIAVDDGKPVGRVDIALLDDASALVTWLEQTPSGAEIRARRIRRGGKPDASLKIADSSSARSSGFPRMARKEDAVWLAWRGKEGVQVARVSGAME
jgi:hypothetical protein